MTDASIARYARARYQATLLIQLLTMAALWGQWRRITILVGISVVTMLANVLGFYRWARRGGRIDRVDDAKNLFNSLVTVVIGHLCGWPLPQWLFLPMNALWLSPDRRRSRWKLAALVLLVVVPALADGVSWLVVACVGALTAIVFRIAELRDAMLAESARELRAANDALGEAQAIAQLGTFACDIGNDELRWSQQLQRIFGVAATPTRDVFMALVHEDDRECVRRALAQVAGGGEPFSHEYRIVRADGDVRWIFSRGHAVVDGGGRIVGVHGTAQDVTDKKKLHARLLLTDRLASLGTLAGGIAHEINNPLSFVLANLEYLGEELRLLPRPPGEAARLGELDLVVDEARQGAERVRRVVRDLRLFAREEARDADGPPSADVNEVLAFAVKMASNEIRHRARLVDDCPKLPRVAASDSRLGQVLLNLLVNAAQAIPEGHVDGNRIRIRGAVRGRAVVVEIEDTGCGIAPHVLATVFDPFFTTKPVGSGMGLGLSICHSIVAGFGGEIAVRSEVGKGSTFSVTIPLAEAEVAIEPAAPSRPAARPRGRVLIVDDDALVAASLRRVLAGHEVELAHRGQDALARLAAARYDVVLCDLLMPELTGMDIYDRVQKERPEVLDRMVFMTGGAFTPRAREFLERVPNARFDKPVDRRWLRAFVDDLVGRRAQAA